MCEGCSRLSGMLLGGILNVELLGVMSLCVYFVFVCLLCVLICLFDFLSMVYFVYCQLILILRRCTCFLLLLFLWVLHVSVYAF